MSLHHQIFLLGDFRVLRQGELIGSVATTRMRSLLGYLVLRREAPQLRAHVAYLFWPDSSEKQALTNLRHLLHELRHALPAFDESVVADSRTLRWKANSPYLVDVVAFDRAVAAAQDAMGRANVVEAKAALEEAAQQYAGDLLPGCDREWIDQDRERLRRDATATLEQLVNLYEESRDYVGAIRHGQRLLQLDPTRETTAATLMRVQLLSGDRAAALQTYQSCVAVLARELNVGPGQKLRELRERALADLTARDAGETGGMGNPAGSEYPLRGRQTEWRALLAAWKEAAAGRAEVLAVVGVAGIGKSRLAEELCRWVERQGGAVARTRSYAAEGRLAYAPAAQWLRSPALRSHLTSLDTVWLAELLRILPELRTARPDLREPPTHEAGWPRQHRFEALSRAVVALRKPLLLLLDDMQWTDRETLEWLRYLLRFAPAAPLLLVGTVRAEDLPLNEALLAFCHDLRRNDQLISIELGSLNAEEAGAVAADVAGQPWSGDQAESLYSETEGNPLFVVESVRAGWRGHSPPAEGAPDQGAKSGTASPLPPKVHAVIITRLTQLSPLARDVAGVAAVIGRAFAFEVLVAVCGRSEDELVGALDELWQRRIFLEQETGTYDFTHDKLREVAYAQIIGARRRLLHRRTAEALTKLHLKAPDTIEAQVAAHWEAAGEIAEAIAAFHRAAEAAKRLHASEEAIRLFQKALSLLRSLPEDPAQAVQELALSTALGVCLVAARGYPASPVWGIYERARELCGKLGRRTEAPVLRALAIASLTSGDLKRAQALGEELLEGFAETQDPIVFVEGHYVLGVTFFWLGRFSDSRHHLAAALERYDPRWLATHLSLYAQDPRAVCLCRLAWTLWYSGYPDQAMTRMAEALLLARELEHPNTEGYILFFSAQLAVDMREAARAEELLAELNRVTERHALHFWQHRGTILTGIARARRTGSVEALEQARAQMATYSKGGAMVNYSQFLGHTAELYLRQQALAESRICLGEAFELLERIEERFYHAELLRLQGELHGLSRDPAKTTEAFFTRALLLARDQGAKSLELRSAMSLGKSWHSRGETTQARDLLSNVYGGFTEGFATADLVEARRLLDHWR